MRITRPKIFLISLFCLLSLEAYSQKVSYEVIFNNDLNDLYNTTSKTHYDSFGGFLGQTNVELKDHSRKKISELQATDKVKVFNQRSQQFEYTQLNRVLKVRAPWVYEIRFKTLPHLYVGPHQRFMGAYHTSIAQSSSKKAKYFRADKKFYTSTQELEVIDQLKQKGDVTLYDLECHPDQLLYLPEYELLSFHKDIMLTQSHFYQKKIQKGMKEVLMTAATVPAFIAYASAKVILANTD